VLSLFFPEYKIQNTVILFLCPLLLFPLFVRSRQQRSIYAWFFPFPNHHQRAAILDVWVSAGEPCFSFSSFSFSKAVWKSSSLKSVPPPERAAHSRHLLHFPLGACGVCVCCAVALLLLLIPSGWRHPIRGGTYHRPTTFSTNRSPVRISAYTLGSLSPVSHFSGPTFWLRPIAFVPLELFPPSEQKINKFDSFFCLTNNNVAGETCR
jgi:hypothetical protein